MESSTVAVDVDPDVQILEALRNKDRLYVLKLGEQLEALIKERRCVSTWSRSYLPPSPRPLLASHDGLLPFPTTVRLPMWVRGFAALRGRAAA